MQKVFEAPMYTARQVAFLIGEKPTTVESWAFGTKGFRSVIEPADRKSHRLSFTNLIELHVLHTIRKSKRIKMSKVRATLKALEREWGEPHPLARVDLETDGVELLAERFGKLVNPSKSNQAIIREAVERSLSRIERTKSKDGIRFFPITRDDDKLGLPKHVVVDARYRFGRPFLADVTVPTGAVYSRILAGESVKSLAADYETSTEAIEEAIRFHSKVGTELRDVA